MVEHPDSHKVASCSIAIKAESLMITVARLTYLRTKAPGLHRLGRRRRVRVRRGSTKGRVRRGGEPEPANRVALTGGENECLAHGRGKGLALGRSPFTPRAGGFSSTACFGYVASMPCLPCLERKAGIAFTAPPRLIVWAAGCTRDVVHCW